MKKGKKWYKSFSSWLVIITSIILVPILIANIYIIFQSKTNKDKVPSVFGYKPFIVLSGSMEGKIHKGDLIITKKVDPTTLKVKDIIAFRDAENTVTTHRIIDIVENNGHTQFITKGDNNSTQDHNLVSLEDVEGIYVGRISGFGSIMKSLSEPTTILALALIITVLFVIGFMISMKKDKDLEREEFLKYKMLKEQETQQKEQMLKEHELEKQNELQRQQEIQRQHEIQNREEIRYQEEQPRPKPRPNIDIRVVKALQDRGFTKEEILELLLSREEEKNNDSDDELMW